jgi:hypothetical protein
METQNNIKARRVAIGIPMLHGPIQQSIREMIIINFL